MVTVAAPPPVNVFTILIGGFLTLAPQLITSLPLAYRALATGIIAMLVQAWHLYMEPPSA